MASSFVVLVSGGIGSTCALLRQCFDVAGDEDSVVPVFVDYGQIAAQEELARAMAVCESIKSPKLNSLVAIDVSGFRKVLQGPCFSKSLSVPDAEADDDKNRHTISDMRLPILLVVAASVAKMIESELIVVGSMKVNSDSFVFDATHHHGVEFEAPMIDAAIDASISEFMGKHEIPVAITWSCLSGKSVHCGVCFKCRERRRAVKASGMFDGTRYGGTPAVDSEGQEHDGKKDPESGGDLVLQDS